MTAALQEDWAGGQVQSGIQEGITGLALNEGFSGAEGVDPEAAARFDAILPTVEEALQGILDGSLEVPFSQDPNF